LKVERRRGAAVRGKNPRVARWRWLSRPRGQPGRAGPRKGEGAGTRPAQSQGATRARLDADPRMGMTTRPHLSAIQGGGRRVGCDGPQDWKGELGRGNKLGCAGDLGQKRKRRKGKRKPFRYFQRSSQELNSNTNLNSNKYKQCNSMSATVNSYSSLIN
jgi:hypothetical protein